MSDVVVRVSHITKIFNVYRKDIQKVKCVLFGRKPPEVLVALDDVSFTVEKGERVGVFGVVGSGRTTLMNILSGVSFASKGKFEVPKSVNVMLHNKAGLEMEFSCRDNVYLKANVVDLPKEIVEEHMDEILEFSELTEYADLPMKRAPKGAPALMSMAVHLLKDSELLLIDEVFGGGGNKSKVKCEQYLKEYLDAHEDVTAIIVTNAITYLKSVCERAIVLDQGKIIFDGPAEEAGNILKTINK